MNKFRFTFRLLTIATFVFAFVSIAQAQATRTWVSGVGDDVNPAVARPRVKRLPALFRKLPQAARLTASIQGGFGYCHHH
jgi:hypothetical protein